MNGTTVIPKIVRGATPKRECGAVMVLYAAGMAVIIGMAGLAIDLGHAYLNRSRLQNALDAGALSGARTISDNQGVIAAESSALSAFNLHLEGEMGDAALVPTVEFSETLVPFTPGAVEPDAKYVRLKLSDFQTTVLLARVLPGVGDTFAVGGSAVAGPSPPLGAPPDGEVCDVVPLTMCAGKDPATGTYDTDCSDGNCYGYPVGGQNEITLKSGAGSGWEIGAGNFQLIQLDCGAGGDCVREELGGKYPGCVINGGTVTTKPGNTVGPVAQGFNTRFGDYQGGMSSSEYPPDAVTYSADGFWYSDYQQRLQDGNYNYTPVEQGGIGVPLRRVLAVPIVDCTGTVNGQGEVQVLGLGCFFMTKPTSHSGQTQSIFGQLVDDNCRASGSIPENPGPGPGPGDMIILYKDPDSTDT